MSNAPLNFGATTMGPPCRQRIDSILCHAASFRREAHFSELVRRRVHRTARLELYFPLMRSGDGSICHRYKKLGKRERSMPGMLTGTSLSCSGTFGVTE